MRVFLYEFVTGGGMFSVSPDEPPSGSLLREGAAMFGSLAEDLSRIPNMEVVTLRDARLTGSDRPNVDDYLVATKDEESGHFDALAADADWTIVIAPEFNQSLVRRTRRVEQLGGRLLGPNSQVVELCACKTSTVEHLAIHGIRTPRGQRYDVGQTLPPEVGFPAVLKPDDGAGSQGIRLLENHAALAGVRGANYRIEELQYGLYASAAVLCGANATVVLPACTQRLSADGAFRYLGGKLPVDEPLRRRAERLALQVVGTLPGCFGYVGIDMILGSSSEFDTVIELNPRVTTSYVGLRRLSRGNLAAAMIDLAEGATPDLSFAAGPVEFLADGTIFHQ